MGIKIEAEREMLEDAGTVAHNKQFTDEVSNIAVSADITSSSFDSGLLEYGEDGNFWGLLESLPSSLMVSREYEHFIVGLDGCEGEAWQSPLPLPHPSGLFYDEVGQQLIVSSTRTPNIIMWYSLCSDNIYDSDIVPEGIERNRGSLFLPKKSIYLPGSLYIHDLVKIESDIYATITGHNFVARLDEDGGWEKVWSPNVVNSLKPGAQFRENFLQLNSLGIGENGLADSYYTGFSDLVTGTKPWKEGYGPEGKGVVFSGETGQVIYRGLTCPHSAKLHEGKLWLCNSGFGEVGYLENYQSNDITLTKFVPVFKAPGFTRGLTFLGDYIFVGLSKVIDKYGPYAPGLDPAESKCGIWVFNVKTGEYVASLDWINGYQIYDVQPIHGVSCPQLPLAENKEGVNHLLRFLG
jgi:uncharacterized protein (TIGR03032 family)